MLREHGRSFMPSTSVGNRPRGIKKQRPVRKSARIQTIQRSRKQIVRKDNHVGEIQAAPTLSTGTSPSRSKV